MVKWCAPEAQAGRSPRAGGSPMSMTEPYMCVYRVMGHKTRARSDMQSIASALFLC